MARIAQNYFSDLDAPVGWAAKDCFVPAASNLELMSLPSVVDLRVALEETLPH